jgi:hypothetical protein
MIEFLSGVDPLIQDIRFDPQTSGGLDEYPENIWVSG